jgi:ribonuclease R
MAKKKGKRPPHRKSSSSPLVRGPISVHHKGFGFVRNESGPDVFIPKHLTKDAVDGDIVEASVADEVSAKGPEGEVVAILERSRTHIAGTIIRKTGGHAIAYSPLLGPDKPIIMKAPKGHTLREGDRVIGKVLTWRNASDLAEAEVSRLIGHISDPSIDIQAAAEEFELPDGFSQEAIDEAKSFGKTVPPEEVSKRVDLTSLECVTIDPTTAKDFDDAITLSKDDKGHYFLGVHIADVAHYVKAGSFLDKEARIRCNSTYFPGQCIPMLPEELSNELCSLKPHVVRLTVSVVAEFDPIGRLVHYEIHRTAIKSKKRFTYEEAYEVLQHKRSSPHKELLERMVELCGHFKRLRSARGSIDFAMPEDVIQVDPHGVPTGIIRVEYDITHQMIEEFMLKANELVAIELGKRGKALIYRVHEEPSDDTFQDFFALARSFGFYLPPSPTHKDIQHLFEKARETPFAPQLSVAFIRSMKLAAYSPENIGHFGLALEHYTHFTSPIRRYIDLVIERLLFNELPADDDLQQIAAACSAKERLSFKAESSVKLLKKLRLAHRALEEDPHRIYDGVVTRIKPFALLFEVPAFDLEGVIHISEIGDDYYEFHPTTLSMRGSRSGETFTAGSPIRLRLDSVDLTLQQSRWSIERGNRSLHSPSPSRRKGPRRSRRVDAVE